MVTIGWMVCRPGHLFGAFSVEDEVPRRSQKIVSWHLYWLRDYWEKICCKRCLNMFKTQETKLHTFLWLTSLWKSQNILEIPPITAFLYIVSCPSILNPGRYNLKWCYNQSHQWCNGGHQLLESCCERRSAQWQVTRRAWSVFWDHKKWCSLASCPSLRDKSEWDHLQIIFCEG